MKETTRMAIGTQIKYYAKDKLKNLAHKLPFLPYRKRSKRYRIWNHKTEHRFLGQIERVYNHNPLIFNAIQVSIIMPVYNRRYCIDKAIESVINQTHENWELIIIDDGSTDDLNEVAAKYSSNIKIKFIHRDRAGVSASRNIGLEEANGEFVFYLDTDNTWYESYLQTMVVYMSTGNLEVAYSGAQIIDDKEVVIGYYGENYNWDECWELNYIDINGLGHRRTLFDGNVKFDETLKRLVDWDFVLQLTFMKRAAYAPFLGVKYYDGQGGNRITFTEFVGNELEQLKVYIQAKHNDRRGVKENANAQIRPHWKQILYTKD